MHVLERSQIGTLTRIAQGGQGVVYTAPSVRTPFTTSMVYKEYKSHVLATLNFDALSAMPAFLESLPYAEGQRLISLCAWPCATVINAGATSGFIMPTIGDKFFTELTTVKGVSTRTAEFQHLLNGTDVLAQRGITLTEEQRYALLREVASALVFLHQHGVCVGDISPKNLLFSLNPSPAVYFIDCDAMRVGGVSILPQLETPGWAVPDGGEELATPHSDTYKLGLLALRLLAGDQDTRNPNLLPSTTPAILRQLIADVLTHQPDKRPPPIAWTHVLGRAIEEARSRPTAYPATVQTVAPASPILPVPPIPWVPPGSPVQNPAAKQLDGFTVLAVVLAVGVAVLGIITAVSFAASKGNSRNDSYPSTPAATPDWTTPRSTWPTTTTEEPSHTPTFTKPAVPPVTGPDNSAAHESCDDGYHRWDETDNEISSVRGTPVTSCYFARNVLRSYLDRYGNASRNLRKISVAGAVDCSPRAGVACDEYNFIMSCVVEGSDNWITCRGGNDAVVYLY
jgi:eukaryotic-like serine/threonine-protein kinase